MDAKPVKTVPTLAYVLGQYHYADEDSVWQRTQNTIPVQEIVNFDNPEKPIAILLKHYISLISLASDKEAILIGVQNEIDTMLQNLKPKPESRKTEVEK